MKTRLPGTRAEGQQQATRGQAHHAPPAGLDLAGLDLAGLVGLRDPAVVHAGVPQAQGDVAVLPWPPRAAPAARAEAVGACVAVPRAGWPVLTGRGGHTHTLLADGPAVLAGADPYGVDLAVLVVGCGSVAVLAHEDHPDLHVGEGVYTLRRQRRHTPEQPRSLTAYVED